MVVLGKVYVAWNPEFDHVLFLVEVDDADGAYGHDGQGGHDHLPWTHADEDPEAAKNQKYFQSLDQVFCFKLPFPAVGPDVRIKSSKMLPKLPKSIHSSFYLLIHCFQNSPKMSLDIWTSIIRKFVPKNFKNIPISSPRFSLL